MKPTIMANHHDITVVSYGNSAFDHEDGIAVGDTRFENICSVLELDDYLNDIDAFIKKLQTEAKDHIVVFTSFSKLWTNREQLLKLLDSDINYRFQDLPQLTPDTSRLVLNLLDIDSTTRSTRIKASIKARREAGKRIGNPEIGDPKAKATRVRKYKSYTNENNILARKRIEELRTQSSRSLSYGELAQMLNDGGYQTARGKAFLPKSVARLEETTSEINKRFNIFSPPVREHVIEHVDGTAFKTLNVSSSMTDTESIVIDKFAKPEYISPVEAGLIDKDDFIPLRLEGITAGQNIEKLLSFKVVTPLCCNIQVQVYEAEQKDGSPLIDKIFDLNDGYDICIDLKEEAILPGNYYFSVFSDDPRSGIVYNFPIRVLDSVSV